MKPRVPGPRNRHSRRLAASVNSRGRQVLKKQATSAYQRPFASRSFSRAALVVLMVSGAIAVAHAETIPLPKPAPKARGPAVPADSSGPSATASSSPTYAGTPPTAVAPPVVRPQPQAQQPQQQQPQSLLPDPRKLFGLGGSTITFDANQRALAAKMSTYLSSISTLSGNFVQVGPNGAKTTGDFVIQKPGKVRLPV